MAIFEDFGFNEAFADTLTTDEMQRLQAAHNTLAVLKDKYTQWQGENDSNDLRAYLQRKAEAVQQEAAECERVRGKYK